VSIFLADRKSYTWIEYLLSTRVIESTPAAENSIISVEKFETCNECIDISRKMERITNYDWINTFAVSMRFFLAIKASI